MCFISILLLSSSSVASLRHFDSEPQIIQAYIVYAVTNCLRESSIMLVHRGAGDASSTNVRFSPLLISEFGLTSYHCDGVLKGDDCFENDGNCFLYNTERFSLRRNAKMPVWIGSDEVLYHNGLEWERLKGKSAWKCNPLYNIYEKNHIQLRDGYIRFMILKPQRSVLLDRIVPITDVDPEFAGGITGLLKEKIEAYSSEKLMEKLGLQSIFGERVFLMNEGCVFQIDCECRQSNFHKSETKAKLRIEKCRRENRSLMHISLAEASEIVYLAYLVDEKSGGKAGYSAACKRCPKILKEVYEFKSSFGKMLHVAMIDGGMISTNQCACTDCREVKKRK